jgi:DNA-binding MarR family transcriptional regulator
VSRGDAGDRLTQAVLRATRKVSSQAALFSQAVADRIGLATIDVESLEVLSDEGPVTVGRLAEWTGLTTGAATRMIDRLEQAGYVRRVADPTDRRRVLVEPVAQRMESLAAIHDSIERAQRDVIARFSDEQLLAIADFLEASIGVARQEAVKMRASGDAVGGGSFAAPVAGTTAGRLVFLSGAPNVVLRGDPSLRELYRAKFEGPVPRVRVRDGVVTVHYGRFNWFDWRARVGDMNVEAMLHWRKDRGEIVLNPAVPWDIELRGGATRLSGDLRLVDLRSFELAGGTSRVELTLPRPTGVVSIRIMGGMSIVSIHRPPGVAARLTLEGGAGQIVLDDQRVKGPGNLLLETPGAGSAAARYDVEITGGASRVALEER